MEHLLKSANNLPKIVEEINEMVKADQDLRARNLESGDQYWDDELDIKNTERMKVIVNEIGWPTISKVGSDVSFAAWLLVQHADHDVDFQITCLDLMKSAPEGDVDKQNIAFLEDRVRVNQGRGQLYGTQFRQENGQHIPQPIEDEANVDARRAEMGMGTLKERVAEMYEKYPFTKT